MLATIGYAAMCFIGPDPSAFLVAPTFMVAGAGIALAIPSLMAATLAYADPQSVGIASGVVNAARHLAARSASPCSALSSVRRSAANSSPKRLSRASSPLLA
ncbi:hypothetical protein PY650_05630 [Rhizobium calliandrae]|uniref:MFS transporter n=1 Tax=Rhizobium calliandrae TaxID=1312182 RepID=A0ABT7K980_9HYPH|nr:hypothetical protein [Rhizobium calliandrae]MDL2405142.1 hypothetical protein [Rhizobium calliandrae]